MNSRTLSKPMNKNSTTFSQVFGKKLSGRTFTPEPANEARDVSNPSFGHNFSDVQVESPSFKQCIPQFFFQDEAAKLGDVTEEVGRAFCDTDKGKMVWSVDVRKLPLCMADCAKEHELSHVKSREKRCKEVSTLAKATNDAIKKSEKSLEKAKKSKSKADIDKAVADTNTAEKAMKEFKNAGNDYETWVKATCRKGEELAYQAGIDKCKTKKIKKSCADLRETVKYTRIMKLWEKFKKNPPNCPKPARKSEKKKAGGSPKSIRKFLTSQFHRPLR